MLHLEEGRPLRELERVDHPVPSLTSYNPATGEVLGSVPIFGPEQVAAAIAGARQAFPLWQALGFAGRRIHLLKFRDALMARRDEIARLLTQENGKPLVDSLMEVLSACEFLKYYAERAEKMLRDQPIRVWNPLIANPQTYMTHQAKGVIAVISPWNFPVLLAIAEVSTALAAGNTCVLKPSELTPLIGQMLQDLARSAGLPSGVFQVVTGDGLTGAALAAATVDRICFTGSVATGKKVAKAATDHLVPVTLELGGKDPALVLPDVDLDFTAKGLVWTAFTNAGQACASTERVYVHQAIAEALAQKIAERTRALVVGNGLDATTEIGPIINEVQLARIEAQVQDAVAKGAKILVGGQRLAGPGTFFAPTVLTDVTDDMVIMQEETFGPLLPLITVADEAEMVARANDSQFGLDATIWTRDTAKGKQLAAKLQCGTVWINTGLVSFGNPLTPRGGLKESGIGKIGSHYGLLEMVNSKLIDVGVHGKTKVWWYPTWPQAYEFFSAGIDLLHGTGLVQRLNGLVRYLKASK